jgi:hypothetical protein
MRVLRIPALIVLLAAFIAPPAQAQTTGRLAASLTRLWETVLTLPISENPYTSPDKADMCVELPGPGARKVIVPFAPFGVLKLTCKVSPGTKIFISAWSSECSTVEPPPYFGRDEQELRACATAIDEDVNAPVVTVDGARVPVEEVETDLITVVMPEQNIFGVAPGEIVQSVGHGWVALLHPLPPGRHSIVLHTTGTYSGQPVDLTNHTTIVVTKGKNH